VRWRSRRLGIVPGVLRAPRLRPSPRALAVIAGVAAFVIALVVLISLLGADGDGVPVGAEGDEQGAFIALGFPSTASKNTIRVGGGDAVADAAGVANAAYPATSDATKPDAVTLVDQDDWPAGVAAAVLASDPVNAPILLTDGNDLPAVTEDTLARLNPPGSQVTRRAQVIRIGDEVATPDDRLSAVIRGDDAYEKAAAVDRFSTAARGEASEAVVIASGEQAPWAMPAAAWAARSGDSVLFSARDRLPEPTRRALEEHDRPAIFILGPETVIGPGVERELRRLGRVDRITAPTPVASAIEFARYSSGTFGWGINVPGFNFVLANTARPLDAAAAAPLASNGVFAPLLLTDTADALPEELENYLLDIQPGFRGDPARGVYNRVWLLGDDEAISREAQGRLDEVLELVPVDVGGGERAGGSGDPLDSGGGTPESEGDDRPRGNRGDDRERPDSDPLLR
jgi:hypothetical protein